MTTTELRAAAERLMVDGALDVPIPVLWDITRVARYVLSLHPADDDTPITEEWLRNVGFDWEHLHWLTNRWTTKSRAIFRITFTEHALCASCGLDDHWMDLPHVNTRGNLRRLTIALGIPLKEGGD